MDKLILLAFDLGLGMFYLLIGFIVFMLIQGIVYWTTGYSIWNNFFTKLINDDFKK